MFWPENEAHVITDVKSRPPPEPGMEQIIIAEMLTMTAVVLESNGVYKSALASNIRAFHQAVTKEGEMEKIRDDLARMQQMLQAQIDDLKAGQKKSEWNQGKDGERRKAAC